MPTKFLVLYRSSVGAREQMEEASPEQAAAGMAAWQAWMETAGPAASTSVRPSPATAT